MQLLQWFFLIWKEVAAFKGRSLLINLFYKLIFRFKCFAYSRIGGNVFLKGNLDEVNKLRTSLKLTWTILLQLRSLACFCKAFDTLKSLCFTSTISRGILWKCQDFFRGSSNFAENKDSKGQARISGQGWTVMGLMVFRLSASDCLAK